MWAKIITIKRTKELNYFSLCALNLFNTRVSQFELNYWNKWTFPPHYNLWRCTCSTWWQNPCWQSQRSDVFVVVGHQVCTHLRRDFVSLLFADPLQVIKVSRLTLETQTFSSLHRFSMGWLARPLQDQNVLLEPPLCCLGRVFWFIVMLEYPSTTHFQCPGGTWPHPSPSSPLMQCSCPVPFAEKHPQI